jgi:hypothetical protein
MALTANRALDHYVDQELRSLPVAASQHVFQGAVVGITSGGYARPLVAGDPVAGIAFEERDNTAGTDGALAVRVYTVGDFGHSLAGAAASDIGRPVFASADDTLVFSGGGNSFAGIVRDVPAGNEVLFRLHTGRGAVKTVSHAVENLSAGQDIAARSVHAFDSDAWIVSARVVNQATTASGIDDSNPCVVTLGSLAGTVATATFNTSTVFPDSNAAADLGAVSNAHAVAGTIVTLTVTNGTTANPGPFSVELDYV